MSGQPELLVRQVNCPGTFIREVRVMLDTHPFEISLKGKYIDQLIIINIFI